MYKVAFNTSEYGKCYKAKTKKKIGGGLNKVEYEKQNSSHLFASSTQRIHYDNSDYTG